MAFKGTDTKLEALTTDFFSILISPTLTSFFGVDLHFQRAITKYNELKGMYPNSQFSFTGHSLGGRTAIVVANYEQTLYEEKRSTGLGKSHSEKSNKNSNIEKRPKVTGEYKKATVSAYATGSGMERFVTQIVKGIKNVFIPKEIPSIFMYRIQGDALSATDFGQAVNAKLEILEQQTKTLGSGCNAHTTLNFLHKDFWTPEEIDKCWKTKQTKSGEFRGGK